MNNHLSKYELISEAMDNYLTNKYEAAGNNKITELGKQARQGQLYVFTYVKYYGTSLPIAALYKKDDFV